MDRASRTIGVTSEPRAGLVVLLGAGASIDAGLPDVEGLTDAVYSGFDDSDEHLRVLEQLALIEASAQNDYETLFKWMDLAMRHAGFRALIGLGGLQRTTVEMMKTARRSIVGVLRRPINETAIAYLSGLARLKPWALDGPLDVFTLNYDLCVESACRAAGIMCSTGFARGAWPPSHLRAAGIDIALHKLHGSINWFTDGTARAQDDLLRYHPLVERDADDRHLAELVMGPASKVQADDPFFFLLNRFHNALQRAALCVVIGYGWRDDHISDRIDRAHDGGMYVVDVNPEPTPLRMGERGVGLSSDVRLTRRQVGARAALTDPLLLDAAEGILRPDTTKLPR